jgi:hypothetical protein
MFRVEGKTLFRRSAEFPISAGRNPVTANGLSQEALHSDAISLRVLICLAHVFAKGYLTNSM